MLLFSAAFWPTGSNEFDIDGLDYFSLKNTVERQLSGQLGIGQLLVN